MPIESFNGYRRNDDYLRDVSRGGVVGARPFNGYGEHVAVGAESNILWPDGVYAIPPAAGVQLSVVSTSANDAAAGTGIRQIVILYLDANLDEQGEILTLNGLTPVLTQATDIRFVQCAFMLAAGSGGVAAGIITGSVGSQVYVQISAGRIRCESSVRMVPKGKRLFVESLFGGATSGSSAARVILRIATPNFNDVDFTASSTFFPLASATYQDNSAGLRLGCPVSFTEGQVVGLTYETDKAATIVGSWFGWLEDYQ